MRRGKKRETFLPKIQMFADTFALITEVPTKRYAKPIVSIVEPTSIQWLKVLQNPAKKTAQVLHGSQQRNKLYLTALSIAAR